jgi:hypothetical protein
LRAGSGASVEVATVKVRPDWGRPRVTAPGTNVNVMTAAAARDAFVTVQITASAPTMAKTDCTSDVLGKRTHVAVPPPVSVLALEELTAVKYLGGRARVILPPTGTAVAGENLNLRVAVLTVPGTLSDAAAKMNSAISTLSESSTPAILPPMAGSILAYNSLSARSVEVATLKYEEAWGRPRVTAPGTNVNVMAAAAARDAFAIVQITASAPTMAKTDCTSDVLGKRTHVAVPPPVSVLALEELTALKYLGGRARVILPPTGTAVAVLKLNLTMAEFVVPGTLSDAAAKTIEVPVVNSPPSETVDRGMLSCASVEVATFMRDAA